MEITPPADGYQKADLEPNLRLTENMEFNWTISRITVGKDEMKAMQDNSFGLTSPKIN